MTPFAPATADEALEFIFTNPNPESGSPAPPHTAWVLFAGGTVFYTFPSETLPLESDDEALVAAAFAALDELGPVVAGTPSADFHPGRLEAWFPTVPVYLVNYDHPAIASVYFAKEGEDGLSVGLLAREARHADYETRDVVVVRGFTGQRW